MVVIQRPELRSRVYVHSCTRLASQLESCPHLQCPMGFFDQCVIYVTVHGKTNHIAQKIVFELRPPLPTMTFELPKLKSNPRRFGYMSENVPQLPVLSFYSKRNQTLPPTLDVEVRILVYTKNVAAPTKSMSQLAARMPEREQNWRFVFTCSCHACLSATMAMTTYHGGPVQLHG